MVQRLLVVGINPLVSKPLGECQPLTAKRTSDDTRDYVYGVDGKTPAYSSDM